MPKLPKANVDRRKRIPMREQAPSDRIKNFDEVALGYSAEEAVNEAKRCLHCDAPMCVEGCPVGIDIPKFVEEIAGGKFDEAAKTVKDKNNLPAICGRVCPQESQCEKKCILGMKWKPLARWRGASTSCPGCTSSRTGTPAGTRGRRWRAGCFYP